MNNAAAQVMMNPGAWQVMGNQAFSMGQQYVNQNVCLHSSASNANYFSAQVGRFIHVQSWKYYWNVSNHYVLSKLALLLFPFRHKVLIVYILALIIRRGHGWWCAPRLADKWRASSRPDPTLMPPISTFQANI